LDATLQQVAERFGTPAYVYFTDAIATRLEELRAAFGSRFELSFAVKSNPNPALLAWLKGRIESLDVSSIGEFRLGSRASWSPAQSSFTGPGKRSFELEEAIDGGIGELVLESLSEALTADRIARELGKVQAVLVRVAPEKIPKGFGDQMAGRPCAFGIDVEDIDAQLPEILALENLRVTGFHIYSGTQCLRPAAICDNYRIFLRIFRDVCERHDLTPKKLIFGSGLGVPYHDADTPLDLGEVAAGINPQLDAFKAEPRFQGSTCVLELGRYMVAESGLFLTRIVSLKESRGSTIGICDGGMNNHLPACGHFGMVIHRNYRMHRVDGGTSSQKYDLVGPLCTSIDRLARGVELPELHPGDLIAVHSSGAYGITASPIHFISHRPPVEILVSEGELRDVSRDLSDV